MTLLAPFGLLALVVLPIILWLYLRREQRRRIEVPSLLLWKIIPRRPEGQRRTHLPVTPLLLLHLALATLLALVLAQPLLTSWISGEARHIVIIVDASSSMHARESGLGDTTRWDLARNMVRERLLGMSNRDTISLIVTGTRARMLGQGTRETLPHMLLALDQVEPDGVSANIPAALDLAQAAWAATSRDYPASQHRLVIISDSQVPQSLSATAGVEWQQVGTNQSNRAIVVFAPAPRAALSGEAPVQVYARVANYGAENFQGSLRLQAGDHTIDNRVINLRANDTAEIAWTVPAGQTFVRAEIAGQDGFPEDDYAALNLSTLRSTEALVVAADPLLWQRALAAIPGVKVTVLTPDAYAAATEVRSHTDITVFDGVVPEKAPPGGVLLVNPPQSAVKSSLIEVGVPLSVRDTPVAGALPDGSLNLRDIAWDGITFESAHTVTVPEWASVVLRAADGPLILGGQTGASRVIIWTFEPRVGPLTARLAFPLLVARTIRSLIPSAYPSAVYAGEPFTITPGAHAESLELTTAQGGTQHIATAPRLVLDATGGDFLTIQEQGQGRTLYTAQVPINNGHPEESDLSIRPYPGTVAINMQSGPNPIAAPTQLRIVGEPLWWWLALVALGLMFIEWMYSTRFRAS